MTRAESMGGLRQVRAVVPVSVIDHELEADLARQPDRAALRGPADRRAQPGGPAAPGVLLVPGPQGDRPRGRRQPARRHRRLRADDVPRDRLAGRGRPSCAAASSCRSPTCPARSPRCTPPARGWSQTYPVPPLLPGHAAGHRRDVVRRPACSTASPPTATRVPDADVLGAVRARGARRAARHRRRRPPARCRAAAAGSREAEAVTRRLPPGDPAAAGRARRRRLARGRRRRGRSPPDDAEERSTPP